MSGSRSHRIVWLMEEIGIEYEIKHYKPIPGSLSAPPELLAMSPIATFPTISDGPIVLSETGAIIEYILTKYGNGQLKPVVGTPEWAQYLYWSHFVEGSMMPLFTMRVIFNFMVKGSPFFMKPITKAMKDQAGIAYFQSKITKQLDYLDAHFAKNAWLTGKEFTAADIQIGILFTMWPTQAPGDTQRLHIEEYVKRIQERPAYKRMIEKLGPMHPERFNF